MTLKTGVKYAENSAAHHRNTFHFTIYLNRKGYFKFTVLLYRDGSRFSNIRLVDLIIEY